MKTEEIKPSGKVHPVAAMFPMMNEEDLEALAVSIAKDGLKEPIVLDDNGDLIDGRNRDAACKRKGIKPHYTLLNGSDPVAFIFAKNSQRRHMTKGQRAMVAVKAELMRWQIEQAKKGAESILKIDSSFMKYGKVKQLSDMAGVKEDLISKAKQVVLYAQNLMDEVIAGGAKGDEKTKTLLEAYQIAQENEADLNSAENQKKKLRAVAPDLADEVDEERRTLPEARAILAVREETARKNRIATTAGLRDCIEFLKPRAYSVQEQIKELVEWYDPALMKEGVTPEIWDQCVAVLAGVVKEIKKGLKDAQ